MNESYRLQVRRVLLAVVLVAALSMLLTPSVLAVWGGITSAIEEGVLNNAIGLHTPELEVEMAIPVTDSRDGLLFASPLAAIRGQKFLDLNADGRRDSEEPGLNGVLIDLYDASGSALFATATTADVELDGVPGIDPVTESGVYWLPDLPPDDYVVRERPEESFVQTYPAQMGSTEYAVTLLPGQVLGAAPAEAEVVCGPGPHWVDNCGTPFVDSFFDVFFSVATIELQGDVVSPLGPFTESVFASGETRVIRGEPRESGTPGHLDTIDTEMIYMELTGSSPLLGPVRVRAGVDAGVPVPSLGLIEELGDPFMVESFFDVFFELDTPLGPLHNEVPMQMRAIIEQVPPYLVDYHSQNPVELFDPTGLPTGIFVTDAIHTPTFGVDFGNAELDFGDAPDPTYATLLASNGPRHVLGSGLFLGASVDSEPDGQPNATATGDDVDILFPGPHNTPFPPGDEDGVTAATPLVAGQPASFTVVASAPGLLDAWLDFNGNGAFDHPAEHLAGGVSVPVVPGPNVLSFSVPSNAVPGTSFARFRISSVGSLPPTGPAPDGEVEDYEVEILITGSIHGFKYEDVDGDGVYNDQVDLPLVGVEFTLTGTDVLGNAVNEIGFTDPLGAFGFMDLVPGSYTVIETVPAGHVATSPTSFSSTVNSGEELVAFEGQAMLPPGDPRVEVLVGGPLMFGNTVPGSIHGFKYEDVDGDGVYNPAVDLPLAGVEFTLTGTDGQGNVINTTDTTDINGEFSFTGLLPSVDGTGPATGYTVAETLPAGFVATSATAFSTDLLSRLELVAFEGQAMLPPGDARVEVVLGAPLMFGNTVPGSVHGFKFEDVDGDSAYNPAVDLPLAGVEFTLTGTDGQGNVINTTDSTDSSGEFSFIGLLPSVNGTGPATGYTVVETVPSGHVATTPTAYSTDLWSRQELVALPGQAMLPAPVPATIDFDDVDASGGPITGVALDSYLNKLGITISDITPSGLGEIVDDRFGFPSQVLRAFSDYNVFWHDSPNDPYAYTLNFATPQDSFSFVRPELFAATPSGLIVSPWRARAFDAQGSLLDTVSEPQLAFFGSTPAVPFTLNGPGISAVIFDRTTPNTIAGLNRVPTDDWGVDVPTDPRREVLVGSDLMFGNTVPGSIHGLKYEDVDGDGVYSDLVDQPLVGVEFTLTGIDGQGNVINTTEATDTNGEFSFTGLLPSVTGTGPATGYTVVETVPTGFVATTPTAYSTDLLSRQELVALPGQATLPPGDPRVEILLGGPLMFGNTVPGSIHGLKYEDVDGDGVYNPAVDLPLVGVEFTLTGTDGQGNVINTIDTTDSNGEFSFTGLLPSADGTGPATGYTVVETVPAGFVATSPTSHSTDLLSREELVALPGQATLPPGDPRVEVVLGAPLMFGNTVPGSIHGFKFEDVDGDGVYDPAVDLPLAGVEFTLTGTDGQGNVINTPDTTDINGEFSFTGLLPSVDGTGPATGYTIVETVPSGFVATTPSAYSTDLLSRQELVAFAGQAKLSPGDPRVEVLLGGPLMFGNTVPGSIHGFKYRDIDLDGVYSPTVDLPLAGAEFTLTGTDGQGNVINTTDTTDSSGEFSFTGLLPSVAGTGPATGYTVVETVPAGFVATTPTAYYTDLWSRQELVALPGQATIPPGDPRVEVLVGSDLMFGNAGTELSVTKVVTPAVASAGETVTYTYYVTNTGDVSLGGVTAVDDALGTVTLGASTLAPDEWTMGFLTYMVIEDDLPGPLVNTVVVTGTPPVGAIVTDTDTVSVTLTTAKYNVWLPVVVRNFQP